MELHDWDMADNINTKDEIYAYLQVALEENNTETLLDVIGAIARSKGMQNLAKELNIGYESLYKSLSPNGNPSFSTVIRVLDLLGFKLQILPKSKCG